MQNFLPARKFGWLTRGSAWGFILYFIFYYFIHFSHFFCLSEVSEIKFTKMYLRVIFCVPLLPTCRFTGSGRWSVPCWPECPTSSSLLKAHLVRSWWRVWPVRILILWRRPAWRDRHCPQWHRTPRDPSRTTNRKTTEDTATKGTAVTKHIAMLGLGPKTRSSRVLNSKIVFFFWGGVKYTEWLSWIIQNMSVYFQIIQCNWEIRRRCVKCK